MIMKANLSSTDRVIRVLLFAITLLLYFSGAVQGVLGIILMAGGAVLALTSIINFCPIYFALGIHTNKIKNQVS